MFRFCARSRCACRGLKPKAFILSSCRAKPPSDLPIICVISPESRPFEVSSLAAHSANSCGLRCNGVLAQRHSTECKLEVRSFDRRTELKFGATVAMDIMRTHPLVIIGGLLRENPFFVPPEQFLDEMRERRSTQKTAA